MFSKPKPAPAPPPPPLPKEAENSLRKRQIGIPVTRTNFTSPSGLGKQSKLGARRNGNQT